MLQPKLEIHSLPHSAQGCCDELLHNFVNAIGEEPA